MRTDIILPQTIACDPHIAGAVDSEMIDAVGEFMILVGVVEKNALKVTSAFAITADAIVRGYPDIAKAIQGDGGAVVVCQRGAVIRLMPEYFEG